MSTSELFEPLQADLASDSSGDTRWMRRALELADQAAQSGEVPVGAVIIRDGTLVAEAGNLKEATQDALGHAEVRAIQAACQTLNRWRLDDCTLFVTLEPCLMCAGAIIHARIGRVVFGTLDPKAGAVRSLYSVLNDPRLNHAPTVEVGVLQEECAHQLKAFFRGLRSRKTKFASETPTTSSN